MTIQIQPGHYYRNRDEDIAGPMRRQTGNGAFPWCMTDGGYVHSYLDDGRYYQDGCPSSLDLVDDLGDTDPREPEVAPPSALATATADLIAAVVSLCDDHVYHGGEHYECMVQVHQKLATVIAAQKESK